MYREEYFYGIMDLLQYNVMISLLKDKIIKEENGIIEVFKKGREEIVIESVNGEDKVIKDTRKDKNIDITNYDLIYLKSFNRFYSDYELKNMVYVNIDNKCFYRVKIDGYKPSDIRLKPIYRKKVDFSKYEEDKEYLEKFYNIFNNVKFVSPFKIKKYLKI